MDQDGRRHGRHGHTDYAQHAMGDIVYVELPDEGRESGPGRTSSSSNR
jgi:glycine cleavage system H protein